MDGKFELVRGGRALKSSYNLPDGKKVKFQIKAVDGKTLEFLQSEKASLMSLLNAEEIVLTLADYDHASGGAAPSGVCGAGTIYLPLAGLIDIAAERAKLEKQRRELDGWIAGSKAKLANERFLAKAPEQVVAEAKAHLAELEEKLARTVELLDALR